MITTLPSYSITIPLMSFVMCLVAYFVNKNLLPKFSFVQNIGKFLYLYVRNKFDSVTSKSSVLINMNNKSAKISYTRMGKTHFIHVPYRRDLIPKMTSHEVYTEKQVNSDVVKEIITQQSGFPYLVSANMLGVDRIVVTKSGQKKIYIGDDIPQL